MTNSKNQEIPRVTDKNFCLSSYMAFRYIYKDNVDFYPWTQHHNPKRGPADQRVPVKTAEDIDTAIQRQFDELYKKYDKIAILLSGGMDSASLATYLKPGSNVYTFTSDLSDVYDVDRKRAEKYCEMLNLKINYVDISFDDYKLYSPILMKNKGAPLHSIEPQIYKAVSASRANGDEIIMTGIGADEPFGGLDRMLSKEWDFNEFIDDYIFLDPKLVLTSPVDVMEIFEKYRLPNNKIDYKRFGDEVYYTESSGSYINVFESIDTPSHYAPYTNLIMAEPLNLERIRNGESKYLIREFYARRYHGLGAPNKVPMPRPVDKIFADWAGPTRPEFRKDIPIGKLTGNQKWQLWCAEQFLNLFEPQTKG